MQWFRIAIPCFVVTATAGPAHESSTRERKLAKGREKIARRLIKKGVQPAPEFGMTMEEFARLA